MNFHIHPKWTFDDALPLVRAIQPKAQEIGFHVTLGGGVLNRGESEHDLDLYFLPMGHFKKADWKSMLEFLEKSWGKAEQFGVNQSYPANYYSFMGRFTYSGLSIDAFIFGGEVEEVVKATVEREVDEAPPDRPVFRRREPTAGQNIVFGGGGVVLNNDTAFWRTFNDNHTTGVIATATPQVPRTVWFDEDTRLETELFGNRQDQGD